MSLDQNKNLDNLSALLAAQPSIHNEAWRLALYEYALNSPVWFFLKKNDEEIVGADGMRYVGISLTDRGHEGAKLSTLTENLIHHGLGLLIYDNVKEAGSMPIAVYRAGDLVSYKMNKIFFESEAHNPNFDYQTFVVHIEEGFRLGTPSEYYFPKDSHKAIKSYLQSVGLRKPGVAMMQLKVGQELISEPRLTFNLFLEDFKNPNDACDIAKNICWFLPRGEPIAIMPKDAVSPKFYAKF